MAEEYGKVKKSTMTAIADAIRAKKDTTAIFTPAQMAMEIEGIEVGGALPPVAEGEHFGGTPIEEQYLIQGETLENIAVAIQNKKETTAIFTPEQMAIEIESLEMASELLNAENYSFGTSTEYEEMVVSGKASNSTQYSYHSGYKFTVNYDFAIYGCKVYGGCGSIRIWDDADRSVVFTQEINTDIASWETVMFSTPVNLFAGKTYMISRDKHSGGKAGTYVYPALNSKVTQVGRGFYVFGTIDQYPTRDAYYQSGNVCAINPLMGPPITESVRTEYKI